MEFQIFHNYSALARKGLCKPLACKYCDKTVTLSIGPDDEPNLVCYFCNVTIVPGLAMYQDLEAVVKEHSLD